MKFIITNKPELYLNQKWKLYQLTHAVNDGIEPHAHYLCLVRTEAEAVKSVKRVFLCDVTMNLLASNNESILMDMDEDKCLTLNELGRIYGEGIILKWRGTKWCKI